MKSWCGTRLMIFLAMGLVGLCSCSQITPGRGGTKKVKGSYMVKEIIGKMPDGKEVYGFTLQNANGLRTTITNYGGIVMDLFVPDRAGKLGDVVLGFDKLDDYLGPHPHFGTLIGRYGNRIGGGVFTLEGVEYKLAKNERQKNHLHGGLVGFDKKLWDAEPIESGDSLGVKLSYLSKDGEEGYPGNLKCTVCIWLTGDNGLRFDYEAETDKATPVNLTHHGYFNLAGQGKRDVLGHELMINAGKFTPIDDGLIPTGELRSVKGTPFDFTKPTAIGARIDEKDVQLANGNGYDHNFVLDNQDGALALAARLYEPGTGRVMEVYTTEPGLQFYTGNFLNGKITGKEGKVYKHRYGFCMETQHYPDSPNKPEFPSTILKPGQVYKHTAIYKFGVK